MMLLVVYKNIEIEEDCGESCQGIARGKIS